MILLPLPGRIASIADDLVGSRTAAMTVVFERCAYCLRRPSPIPGCEVSKSGGEGKSGELD